MAYRYCCPSCGREIKEEEVAVNLAPLLFAGAKQEDISLAGVYIQQKSFVQRINQVEYNGKARLTFAEIFEIIYDEHNSVFHKDAFNSESLFVEETKASNAKDAMDQFLVSVQKMKNRPEQINSRLNEIREEKEQLEEKQRKKEEKKNNSFGSFSYIDYSTEEDVMESLKKEELSLKKELKEKTYWRQVVIPGLNELLVKQLLENCNDFQSAQAQDDYAIVIEDLLFNEDFGYTASVKGIAVEGRGRFCPFCKGKGRILTEAFKRRQFVVGLVGTQNVGKSCLIASLVDFLMRTRNGALDMTNDKWDQLYRKQFLEPYRFGRETQKTFGGGDNCFNPSVRTPEGFIWTFVDVAGEAIQDKDTKKFSPQRIMQYFESVLRCDAYIFCVSKTSLSDAGAFGEIGTIFTQFLRMLKPEKRNPVLLTLTQIDKSESVYRPIIEIPGCNSQEYVYMKESLFMVGEGVLPIMQAIGEECYYTAFTTSAYGDKPLPVDSSESQNNSPRNLDKVIEWVLRQYGLSPVNGYADASSITFDGSGLRRQTFHENGDIVRYISRMYLNPSEDDLAVWEADNGSLIAKVQLFALKTWKRIKQRRAQKRIKE